MLKHKYQLTLTYILFGLEMTGALLRPFFLGMAINDLMKNSYQGLIYLSAVHLLYLGVGTVRHMIDTRTYSAIYTSLVTRFLARRIHASQVSKLSAHSNLAREFVDFLEFDLVYVVEALFNVLGSLILLFFYDPKVVMLCMTILLPVMAISYFYGKKMKRLNRFKNDELEKQVDIIGAGNNQAMQTHYHNLRKWQVRISDQEAWSFGLMELLVLIVVASALLITHKVSGTVILAGNLVGIYNYILKFASGLDTIPYTVQKLSALSDITRRIELNADDIQPDPVLPPADLPSIPKRNAGVKLSA
ncbi:MAG: ABC transporter six-transmembrane domain-containing protein [Ferruginibacter sp.]